MKKHASFECIGYIPPKVKIVNINCQHVLCQTSDPDLGEAPDMDEGWTLDF